MLIETCQKGDMFFLTNTLEREPHWGRDTLAA